MLTWEGVASMGLGSVTAGGILAAFALALGANNFQIGVLAAIPFITQPFQLLFVVLIERLRKRKVIAVPAFFVVQSLWILVALVPVFIDVPSALAVSALLGLIAIRGFLSAATTAGYSSWIRDIVPQQVIGSFFSRRLMYGTLLAAALGLAAAFFVDFWRGQSAEENAVLGFTIVIAFGALILGIPGAVFMLRMPEPQMPAQTGPQLSPVKMLAAPLGDRNFRQLMKFLFSWGFALNLAVPFFAIYMLERLKMPLSEVVALTVLSQLANILFLRVWGPLIDRLGNKAVLSVNASLYILVILGWTFTTMPDRHDLTIPLLVLLHFLAGAAGAGISVAGGTIGMKLSPQGQATPYLAGASMAANLGAGIGPLVGGLFADFFSVRQITVEFTWTDPSGSLEIPAVHLTGYDFLFATAFVIGLITLNTLTTIREEGDAGREVVMEELMAESRDFTQAMSSVPGLRFVTQFPLSYLRQVPGMDVALGVTAYQIAATTRAAVTGTTFMGRTAKSGASVGIRTTAHMVEEVTGVLTEIVEHTTGIGETGVDVARHAARGVAHAAGAGGETAVAAVHESTKAVMDVLGRTSMFAGDAIRGVAFGAIQGSGDSGADLAAAAVDVVEVAREEASRLGLSEEEAVRQATRGTLEAAAEMGPEAVAQVTEALAVGIPGAGSEQAGSN
jgi:MFS family permease